MEEMLQNTKIDNDIKDTKKFDMKNEIFEWFESIIFAVTTVIIIFTFIFRIVGVEGQSMQNTLNSKFQHSINEVEDRVILTSFMYQPERGDIVVCAVPGEKPIIKRVIGIGGDKIYFDKFNGEVYVNDNKIEEPYIKNEPFNPKSYYDVEYPIILDEDEVFVLGDNRNNSKDSRFSSTGNIKKEYILGKAVFRIYPFDSIGTLD